MRIKEIFTIEEARREPARNIRYTPADIINRYGNRDDVFVHFSNTPKLGINPQTKHNTPMGLYAYPVSYVANAISRGERTLHDRVPFMSEAQYVTVLEETGNIVDLCNDQQVKSYLKPLQDVVTRILYQQGYDDTEAEDFIVRMFDYTRSNPLGLDDNGVGAGLWAMTYYTKEELFDGSISSWSKIFMQLGIDCVVDSCGSGIIHRLEPTQAIHFRPQGTVNVIEMMDNSMSGVTPPREIIFDDAIDQSEHTLFLELPEENIFGEIRRMIFTKDADELIYDISKSKISLIFYDVLNEVMDIDYLLRDFDFEDSDLTKKLVRDILSNIMGLYEITDEDIDSGYMQIVEDLGTRLVNRLKRSIEMMYVEDYKEAVNNWEPLAIITVAYRDTGKEYLIRFTKGMGLEEIDIEDNIQLKNDLPDGSVNFRIPKHEVFKHFMKNKDFFELDDGEFVISNMSVRWIDYGDELGQIFLIDHNRTVDHIVRLF